MGTITVTKSDGTVLKFDSDSPEWAEYLEERRLENLSTFQENSPQLAGFTDASNIPFNDFVTDLQALSGAAWSTFGDLVAVNGLNGNSGGLSLAEYTGELVEFYDAGKAFLAEYGDLILNSPPGSVPPELVSLYLQTSSAINLLDGAQQANGEPALTSVNGVTVIHDFEPIRAVLRPGNVDVEHFHTRYDHISSNGETTTTRTSGAAETRWDPNYPGQIYYLAGILTPGYERERAGRLTHSDSASRSTIDAGGSVFDFGSADRASRAEAEARDAEPTVGGRRDGPDSGGFATGNAFSAENQASSGGGRDAGTAAGSEWAGNTGLTGLPSPNATFSPARGVTINVVTGQVITTQDRPEFNAADPSGGGRGGDPREQDGYNDPANPANGVALATADESDETSAVSATADTAVADASVVSQTPLNFSIYDPISGQQISFDPETNVMTLNDAEGERTFQVPENYSSFDVAAAEAEETVVTEEVATPEEEVVAELEEVAPDEVLAAVPQELRDIGYVENNGVYSINSASGLRIQVDTNNGQYVVSDPIENTLTITQLNDDGTAKRTQYGRHEDVAFVQILDENGNATSNVFITADAGVGKAYDLTVAYSGFISKSLIDEPTGAVIDYLIDIAAKAWNGVDGFIDDRIGGDGSKYEAFNGEVAEQWARFSQNRYVQFALEGVDRLRSGELISSLFHDFVALGENGFDLVADKVFTRDVLSNAQDGAVALGVGAWAGVVAIVEDFQDDPWGAAARWGIGVFTGTAEANLISEITAAAFGEVNPELGQTLDAASDGYDAVTAFGDLMGSLTGSSDERTAALAKFSASVRDLGSDVPQSDSLSRSLSGDTRPASRDDINDTIERFGTAPVSVLLKEGFDPSILDGLGFDANTLISDLSETDIKSLGDRLGGVTTIIGAERDRFGSEIMDRLERERPDLADFMTRSVGENERQMSDGVVSSMPFGTVTEFAMFEDALEPAGITMDAFFDDTAALNAASLAAFSSTGALLYLNGDKSQMSDEEYAVVLQTYIDEAKAFTDKYGGTVFNNDIEHLLPPELENLWNDTRSGMKIAMNYHDLLTDPKLAADNPEFFNRMRGDMGIPLITRENGSVSFGEAGERYPGRVFDQTLLLTRDEVSTEFNIYDTDPAAALAAGDADFIATRYDNAGILERGAFDQHYGVLVQGANDGSDPQLQGFLQELGPAYIEFEGTSDLRRQFETPEAFEGYLTGLKDAAIGFTPTDPSRFDDFISGQRNAYLYFDAAEAVVFADRENSVLSNVRAEYDNVYIELDNAGITSLEAIDMLQVTAQKVVDLYEDQPSLTPAEADLKLQALNILGFEGRDTTRSTKYVKDFDGALDRALGENGAQKIAARNDIEALSIPYLLSGNDVEAPVQEENAPVDDVELDSGGNSFTDDEFNSDVATLLGRITATDDFVSGQPGASFTFDDGDGYVANINNTGSLTRVHGALGDVDPAEAPVELRNLINSVEALYLGQSNGSLSVADAQALAATFQSDAAAYAVFLNSDVALDDVEPEETAGLEPVDTFASEEPVVGGLPPVADRETAEPVEVEESGLEPISPTVSNADGAEEVTPADSLPAVDDSALNEAPVVNNSSVDAVLARITTADDWRAAQPNASYTMGAQYAADIDNQGALTALLMEGGVEFGDGGRIMGEVPDDLASAAALYNARFDEDLSVADAQVLSQRFVDDVNAAPAEEPVIENDVATEMPEVEPENVEPSVVSSDPQSDLAAAEIALHELERRGVLQDNREEYGQVIVTLGQAHINLGETSGGQGDPERAVPATLADAQLALDEALIVLQETEAGTSAHADARVAYGLALIDLGDQQTNLGLSAESTIVADVEAAELVSEEVVVEISPESIGPGSIAHIVPDDGGALIGRVGVREIVETAFEESPDARGHALSTLFSAFADPTASVNTEVEGGVADSGSDGSGGGSSLTLDEGSLESVHAALSSAIEKDVGVANAMQQLLEDETTIAAVFEGDNLETLAFILGDNDGFVTAMEAVRVALNDTPNMDVDAQAQVELMASLSASQQANFSQPS